MRAATLLRTIVADTVALRRLAPHAPVTSYQSQLRSLATRLKSIEPTKNGYKEFQGSSAKEVKPRAKRGTKVKEIKKVVKAAKKVVRKKLATSDELDKPTTSKEQSKGPETIPESPKTSRSRKPRTKAVTVEENPEEELSELDRQRKADLEKPIRGRPRIFGPALPTQLAIVNGRERLIKFRPGRHAGFFSKEEDEERAERREKRQAMEERRRELGDLYRSGRRAVIPSALTLIARKSLEDQKIQEEKDRKEEDWEWAPSEDGETKLLPPKRPGAKKKDLDENIKWTVSNRATTSETWQSMSVKKIAHKSPAIASILREGLPDVRAWQKSLIVNETKCSEIFERFDLREYEGCHILDFNPGYGVFSRELNKAVKPSKHFLLESEAPFVPFLERICTDESFRIVEKDMYDWRTLDELVESGAANPMNMSGSEGVNKSLLITGMLHKEVKGDRFMAQIIDAIGKQEWVFKYGRVKCLLWVDDEMLARYIPRSFGRRNRAAVLAEAFTDIRIVAQPPQIYTWSDHRFLTRIDLWNEPDHVENSQDILTGVSYANQLTYITMSRKPEPIQFEPDDYWPPLPWAQNTLLEITPKSLTGYLGGEVKDSEPWKFFNHMLTSTFLSRHAPMKDVLRKMGGGAESMLETEEELRKIPGLAEKHAAHISVDELVKLAEAYEFWPWRNDDQFFGVDLRLSRAGMVDED
ncbi:hypothetical protein ABW20_dc0100050 [Dactylellina cionopaga]|nr:hypothetical protein ABW20_dc0100050 [Dactylellina cionopaga]